jgi:hypothetical protein
VAQLNIEQGGKMLNPQAGHTPSSRGHLSESKVLTAYIEAGFVVSVPFGGGAPYDLIVDTGVKLLRVQVKTGRLRNGCILFAAQRIHGHHGTRRYKYEANEFDCFAVYCPENDQTYVVPMLGDLAEGRLRISVTRNGQQQNVRWAQTFTFENHLKNLVGKFE